MSRNSNFTAIIERFSLTKSADPVFLAYNRVTDSFNILVAFILSQNRNEIWKKVQQPDFDRVTLRHRVVIEAIYD